MRRVKATIFSIVSIIVALLIIARAGEIGASWPVTIVAIVIIILVLFSLVRTWLRG